MKVTLTLYDYFMVCPRMEVPQVNGPSYVCVITNGWRVADAFVYDRYPVDIVKICQVQRLGEETSKQRTYVQTRSHLPIELVIFRDLQWKYRQRWLSSILLPNKILKTQSRTCFTDKAQTMYLEIDIFFIEKAYACWRYEDLLLFYEYVRQIYPCLAKNTEKKWNFNNIINSFITELPLTQNPAYFKHIITLKYAK